ncbi:hypothetical protein [Pseudoclavibacter sp. VKM Ac-2888]|uniref:hypothetical protein n=1 Tax=Pseudoclavibacter sp. VKM Ac-2888 TaxID=2783830 RepID=UPI00188CD1A4|nr:hypothetical protein [Pseudoclavibacter sp. VKM Ac-2888]MBF4549353.1 hypothetical protein [Pseudoclavibacter sp. VKM Ac-2888]
MTADQATLTAIWFSIALLGAGYARSRNRSAWTWFLLTLLTGPIALFLLVVWPAREPKPDERQNQQPRSR